ARSIRAMYKWYSQSSIGIVYLTATASFSDIDSDSWFRRGWTLQELVAPRCFLGKYDEDTGPVLSLSMPPTCKAIQRLTKIAIEELHGFTPGIGRSMASRMLWIQNSTTTRAEDHAYLIIGISGVDFPVRYSKGEEAFFHL
ncbi:hypothetical protein HYPSUDRAFT_113492, partial [Hypholoma sublateritium FD-334 SS-4]